MSVWGNIIDKLTGEDAKPVEFDDVKGQIKFSGFTDPQKESILNDLERVYGTESGREVIDKGLNGDGLHYLNSNSQAVLTEYSRATFEDPRFRNSTVDSAHGGNFALTGSAFPRTLSPGRVYINEYDSIDSSTGLPEIYTDPRLSAASSRVADADPVNSVDHNGKTFEIDPFYILVHETNHAAADERDIEGNNRSGGQYFTPGILDGTKQSVIDAYEGLNESNTQEIMKELNYNQLRGSYLGTDQGEFHYIRSRVNTSNSLDDPTTPYFEETPNNWSVGDDLGLAREHDVGLTISNDYQKNAAGFPSRDPVTGDLLVIDGNLNMTSHVPVRAVVVDNDGPSTLALGDLADTVHAFDGNDVISTGDGDDRAFGGHGDDKIEAGWGSKILDGGDANLDPSSDHLSDQKTDWGVDTVDYTNLNVGLTNSLKYAYDGVSPPGVEISIKGDDVTVNKGRAHVFDKQDDVDQLNNIDIVKATDRADITKVEDLSSDMLIDGSGGLDTLRIDTLPEGTEVTNVPGGGMFHGQPYDGYIQIGTNKLYYNDYENFELPKAEAEVSAPEAALKDAAGATSEISEMPMEEAITILRDESDEALRLGPETDQPDAIAPMLNSSAGASVMQTLIDNAQSSIPVSLQAMAGNAYQRVEEILKGSVDRLNEIDKVHEAEMRYEEIENDRAFESENSVSSPTLEDEVSYGL